MVVLKLPWRVPISKKNPSGQTIVDRHLRHIDGQYLDLNLIDMTFKNYDKKNILYPVKGKLNLKSPFDPDMIKALIATETTFNPNAVNAKATGLNQITTDTLKILQDLGGESKDIVLKDIRRKDLKDPSASVALGAWWLAYKKKLRRKVLKRTATYDEVIQIYKGILNEKSTNANDVMKKYRMF